jgi:hypothetical protein
VRRVELSRLEECRADLSDLTPERLEFIDSAPWAGEGPEAGEADRDFSIEAIRTFVFQQDVIPDYGAYARHLGLETRDCRTWRDIAAVPVSAFRSHDLSASLQGNETVQFETSGTTISRPGRVRLTDTSIYEASLSRNFVRHLLPDGARLHAVIFGPAKAEAPHSSLWFMADHLVRELCAGGTWVVQDGEPQWERADEEFERAQAGGRALLLFSTTLLFQAWFERCDREGIRFRLPVGSRAMDTGGSKGAAVDISRENVQDSFERVLGIPATHVVNEYGMAEMGSQFYEDSLLAAHEDRAPRPGFAIPPWVRTRVLDPETMRDVPEGKSGVLVHYDLANLEIPLAIQTEDVGSVAAGRLRLEGRLPEAERRGCSLPFERFVERERA